MMFICSILSNLISIHSAGCQTPLLVLCPGSVKVMSTMVDTVVQNQVETIEVVKPTVVLWQRHWYIFNCFPFISSFFDITQLSFFLAHFTL